MGELHPDLVGAAGVETHLHQRQGVGFGQHRIVQRGLPHALAHPPHHIALVVLRVPEQQVRQGAGVLLRVAPQHRQILLGDRMGGHGGGQLSGHVPAAGEHHHAAHNPVQPVDGGDVVLFPAALIVRPQQRRHTGAVGAVLRQHAHRLHRHHEILVLIENGHGRHRKRRPR